MFPTTMYNGSNLYTRSSKLIIIFHLLLHSSQCCMWEVICYCDDDFHFILSCGHRTGKGQFSFQCQKKKKKKNAKECSNYRTIALISHTSKVTLKILQARLQQYVDHELPDIQAGFRKGRGNREQIANICWIIEKAREFQKNIYFHFIDYAKAFDCVESL